MNGSKMAKKRSTSARRPLWVTSPVTATPSTPRATSAWHSARTR